MTSASEWYPPFVLRDYALIADGERGALVGPRGDIAWLCAPAWDSDAVFSNLIGGEGHYAVTPLGRFTWGGHYDARSLVWNSRWVTSDGVVECREALARPAEPDTVVILRHIRVLRGEVRIRALLDIRAGFGVERMTGIRKDDRGVWTGRSGPMSFRWSGAPHARRHGSNPLETELALRAGDVHDLVLELTTGVLDSAIVSPSVAWDATGDAWQSSVPDLAETVIGRRDAEQAIAVLTGLTSTAGGMSAAATMSLPERSWTGRNYDYRYAWIRDQCYGGRAAALHGCNRLLDSAVEFVSQRLLDDGPNLKPAYTVRGNQVPSERSLPMLSGYPGGADKLGNHVNEQFQLDTFGESLELLAAAGNADRMDSHHWKAAETAVAAIEERWGEADAGIWELDDQHWTHSRLTCVSGLRAISAIGGPDRAAGWSALADAILADVSSTCMHPGGRWQRSPTDARVDAALLIPAVRGALPPNDPRTVATLNAVEAELAQEDYVYRFQHGDRPLAEAEGAFVLCGFFLALAKKQQGDHMAARVIFERNRSACSTTGLFSEEYDVSQRQLRGNYPQAFVHALLLECSAILTDGYSG